MGLPREEIRHEVVVVAGQDVKVRQLTFKESVAVGKLVAGGDIERSTLLGIAYSTDTDIDEVEAWAAETPKWVIQRLAEEIARITGLGGEEEVTKSG